MSQQNISDQQAQLFATQQNVFGWKSVLQAKRGDIIVVMNEEVKLLNVRQSGDELILVYNDPVTNNRVEQLYRAHDSIYCRL
jgi:hypothetical protein